METSAGRPFRRTCRLQDFTYRGGAYYVTVCSFARRCIFGSVEGETTRLSPCGEVVEQEWLKTAGIRPGVVIDEYIVMPNHLHGLVWVPDLPNVRGDLSSLMCQFKGAVTRRVREAIPTFGKVWQRGFHEHVVRNEKDLVRIRKYIHENPIRWAFDRENPEMRR